MTIKGKILKINNKTITVEILSDETCKECKGCIKAFAPCNETVTGTALIKDDYEYNVGETIELEPLQKINAAFGAFILFGLPLIGFFAGILLSPFIFQSSNDILRFSAGLITAILLFAPASVYSNFVSKKKISAPDFEIISKAK
ncbi:MAG: SoxR reducing system RseC family protein [Candidatus Riflebacteria bacterium]|nr:SoxR reducing system RseC family protein [Candidatus Riflebacteria bacterium]